MAIASIKYQGMATRPDDYTAPDGQAELAVNIEMHEDSWQPMRQPREPWFEYDGFHPRFVHTTSDGNTYIFGLNDSHTLACYKYAERGKEQSVTIDNTITADNAEDITNFCAIGNVVNFTRCKRIYHIIYTSSHFRITDHLPPFLPLYFAAERMTDGDHTSATNASGTKVTSSQATVYSNIAQCIDSVGNDYAYELPTDSTYNGLVANISVDGFKQWYKTTDSYTGMLNVCLGKHNQIHAELRKKNRLMYPVLLRYALRMYDGSYVQPSNPILIYPTETSVKCEYENDTNYTNGEEPISTPSGCTYKYHFKSRLLHYDCYRILLQDYDKSITQSVLNTIRNDYKDLVTAVDFFMSDELYTIDTTEMDIECRDITVYNISKTWAVCSPRFKSVSLADAIEKVTGYYRILSVDIDKLAAKIGSPLMPEDSTTKTYENYTQHPTLDDTSIYGATQMTANGLFAFNSRLIAYGIGRHTPTLHDLRIYCPEILNNTSETLPTNYNTDKLYPVSLAAYALELEDKLHGCSAVTYYKKTNQRNPIFYYTTDTAANRLIMTTGDPDKTTDDDGSTLLNGIYINKFNTHETLGGKYFNRFEYETSGGASQGGYIDGFDDQYTGQLPEATADGIFRTYANQVKESEVNNPYSFPDSNNAVCGSQSVLALAVNATPVSTGQFGEYPIFAFCSDGIFSVGINTLGELSTSRPYSYDILTAPTSIANVGSMVTFVSRSGLTALGASGESNTMLTADHDYARTAIWNTISSALDTASITEEMRKAPDTASYLTSGASVAYDYPHQRILVFNPDYNYTYVCDIASRSWSILPQGFSRALSAPGKCLLVDRTDDSVIYDYSTDDIVTEQNGTLLTRPFKLGAPDTYKTINAIIQRGNFHTAGDNALTQALYGSTDLYHWHPVHSSQTIRMQGFAGTPYKYYRLLVTLPSWHQGQTLTAATVSANARITDKER